MEQKQLDELEDDSFFGEEFIEDLEDLPPVSSSQEIKIEPREEAPELRLHKAKKAASLPIKKSAVKKTEKVAVKPSKEVEEKPFTAKAEPKEFKEKKVFEPEVKRETATISVKPAKEQAKETKSSIETSSPVNPWEDDGKSSSLFKETSTWKALTGIAVVLLILSLFTQGFNFSDKNSVTGAVAASLSLQEAEQQVLEYVNTQLLEFPFMAELQSSEELDTLYKVTLLVSGQTVDSYVTKDGKLFFPQGLDMNEAILEENTDLPSEPELENPVEEVENEGTETEEPVEAEQPEVVEVPETPQETVGEVTELTVNAKKWIFQPNVLRVKKGDKVTLKVVPTELDFTFAVPALGVEQKITGTTEVTFTADKKGTFDFTCGSCEEWRGMRGNLVVE